MAMLCMFSRYVSALLFSITVKEEDLAKLERDDMTMVWR